MANSLDLFIDLPDLSLPTKTPKDPKLYMSEILRSTGKAIGNIQIQKTRHNLSILPLNSRLSPLQPGIMHLVIGGAVGTRELKKIFSLFIY